MEQEIKEINDFLTSDNPDTKTAFNIILNAVQISYEDDENFNQLDKALIAKSLACFCNKINNNETIVINV
jgi:hypothetical protein